MVIAGVLIFLPAATALGYAQFMINKVNNAVNTEDLIENHDLDLEGPMNLLVLGSDMREGWDAAQADTIMIMHINEDLTKASIISIPRDLYVTIPDCGEHWNYNPCDNKINHAFAAGGSEMKEGVANMAATLTELTGAEFFGAAVIDFGGFEDMVETLGGVELCIPFDMHLRHPRPEGEFVEEGCQQFDADTALRIVRERYAYGPETSGWTEEWGIGDYGRQRMQQHFIRQLLVEAQSQGYMSNPTKIGTLVEEIGGNIVVDLAGNSVVDFAYEMAEIDIGNLTTLKVPSTTGDTDVGSSVVITPEHEAAAEDLWQALRDDTLDQWAVENPDWVTQDTQH